MEIGERLKKARTDIGLTQEQVAEELGVSRQSISNWENNVYYDAGMPFNPFEVIYYYFAENIREWIPITFIIGCISYAAGIFIGSSIRWFLLTGEKAEDEKISEAK